MLPTPAILPAVPKTLNLFNPWVWVSKQCNDHRCAGIRKVALLDFDVHHGNGTQACVGRVVPQVVQYPVATPLCEGGLRFQSFHPWLDEQDHKNILFARYGFYAIIPRQNLLITTLSNVFHPHGGCERWSSLNSCSCELLAITHRTAYRPSPLMHLC